MKYVYKIHSGHDGFTPARIPQRLVRNVLRLGWKKYIDTVEPGDEIWVYFRGPQKFDDGVYAKGIAKEVDYAQRIVHLSVTDYATDRPLADRHVSARIALVVATRYRQVFVLPEELDRAPVCSVLTTADSCVDRQCASCPSWKSLPLVKPSILKIPRRLAGHVDIYVPAYWVIPSRSFLYYEAGMTIRKDVRRSSEVFMKFKTGEKRLAYPLALGMHRALAKANTLDADVIVPVPLSPDKARRGELNRTLALANELGRLMSVPVQQTLNLAKPVSKRALRTGLGYNASQFEAAYSAALQVDPIPADVGRVLLVDDVCTEGSTLRTCGDALSALMDSSEVIAVTAGQMTVRHVIKDPGPLWQKIASL